MTVLETPNKKERKNGSPGSMPTGRKQAFRYHISRPCPQGKQKPIIQTFSETHSEFTHTSLLSVHFHFNEPTLSCLMFTLRSNSFLWHKTRNWSPELQVKSSLGLPLPSSSPPLFPLGENHLGRVVPTTTGRIHSHNSLVSPVHISHWPLWPHWHLSF